MRESYSQNHLKQDVFTQPGLFAEVLPQHVTASYAPEADEWHAIH
jgi:hypothetical protein